MFNDCVFYKEASISVVEWTVKREVVLLAKKKTFHLQHTMRLCTKILSFALNFTFSDVETVYSLKILY